MKMFKTMLAAAGVLAATTATPAWADFNFPNVCGGSHFETCASVSLVTNGDGTVTISVTNLSGESVYPVIGLINLPAGTTITSWTSGNGLWNAPGASETNQLNGDGLGTSTYGVQVTPPGPGNGIMMGETVSITFTFNAPLTAQQLADLGVGIRGISGPNGCSTKFGVNSGGAVRAGDYDPACMETVIPEPITMTLLATGLAGMGGAGLVRRRKKGDEIA